MGENLQFGNNEHEKEANSEVLFEESESLSGILGPLLKLKDSGGELTGSHGEYPPARLARMIMHLAAKFDGWHQEAVLLEKPFHPEEWLPFHVFVLELPRAGRLRTAVVQTLIRIAKNHGNFYDAETAEHYQSLTGEALPRADSTVNDLKGQLKHLELIAAEQLTSIHHADGRETVRTEIDKMEALLQTMNMLHRLGKEMNADVNTPEGRESLEGTLSNLKSLLDEM